MDCRTDSWYKSDELALREAIEAGEALHCQTGESKRAVVNQLFGKWQVFSITDLDGEHFMTSVLGDLADG